VWRHICSPREESEANFPGKKTVKKLIQEEILQRRVMNKARYWQRRLSRETLLFPHVASFVASQSSFNAINL